MTRLEPGNFARQVASRLRGVSGSTDAAWPRSRVLPAISAGKCAHMSRWRVVVSRAGSSDTVPSTASCGPLFSHGLSRECVLSGLE